MGFRTVIIKNRCKLEYSLNYLVCRNDKETRIVLDEISELIIDSLEVSITSALLCSLIEKNIKVMFCDFKHNPISQLLPIYGTSDTYKKISIQTNWNDDAKEIVWKQIIKKKIFYQAQNVKHRSEESFKKLTDYMENVEIGDKTNREGHAAKVYFNTLFGNEFSRREPCDINKYLDYGYSIILSSINREIKTYGYLTELGIHHIGETNPFNLSCDFIEPLRAYVDSFVTKGLVNDDNFKETYINILNEKVHFQNNEMYLENAIKQYVLGLLNNLKNNTTEIDFIQYEL